MFFLILRLGCYFVSNLLLLSRIALLLGLSLMYVQLYNNAANESMHTKTFQSSCKENLDK